jgi:protocatechuate 3,4-dioxygenase beta subunit
VFQRRLKLIVVPALAAAVALAVWLCQPPARPSVRPEPSKPAEAAATLPPGPTPEPPATPHGRVIEVVNVEGQAVAGARVRHHRTPELLSVSDAGGIAGLALASLRFDEQGLVRLIVAHADYAPEELRLGRHTRRARVVLHASAALVVRVRDEEGRPVPDAAVKSAEPPDAPEVRCDAQGVALLASLAVGAVPLIASAPDYVTRHETFMLSPGQTREVTVALEKGRKLPVRTLDPNGRPVASARVYLSEDSHRFRSEGKTDLEGLALLGGVPPWAERVSLVAQHPDYQEVQVGHDTRDALKREVVIHLEQAATLVVTVLDEAGQAVEAELQLSDWQYRESFDASATAAPGRPAVIGSVPAGPPIFVAVFQQGACVHEERGLILAAGERRELTIRVPGRVGVRVRVRDESGEPVAGWLSLGDRSGRLSQWTEGSSVDEPLKRLCYHARVPASGEAELRVTPGRYGLEFKTDAGGEVDQEVHVAGGETLEIAVPHGRRLRGRVEDGAGQPRAGLELYWRAEYEFRHAVTDIDGRFVIPRISGRPGKLFVLHGFKGLTPVFDGAPAEAELALVYRTAPVRGRILAGGTADGAQASLRVRPVSSPHQEYLTHSDEERVVAKMFVGPDGRFEFALPDGTWEIEAVEGRMRSAPARFEASGSAAPDIELRLKAP